MPRPVDRPRNNGAMTDGRDLDWDGCLNVRDLGGLATADGGSTRVGADALTRWPERHAQVVSALAHAAPGGVLIHCGRGCDRTGIATLLLLTLAGVSAADIAEDYARSAHRLATREPDYQTCLTTTLARHNTCARTAIAAVVSSLDPCTYLRRGGLTDEEIHLARCRLTVRSS